MVDCMDDIPIGFDAVFKENKRITMRRNEMDATKAPVRRVPEQKERKVSPIYHERLG